MNLSSAAGEPLHASYAPELWVALPLTALAIAAFAMGAEVGLEQQTALTVACVLLFGFPHGALDFAIYRLHHPQDVLPSQIVWLASYAGLAVFIGLLWWFLPLAIFPLLLLNAWQHFGREDTLASLPSPLKWLDILLRGALVLVLPLISFPGEMTMLFSLFMPSIDSAELSEGFLDLNPWLLAMVGGLLLVDIAWQSYYAPLRCAELAMLALLFSTVPPLMAFTVYFCFWHSARHLRKRWQLFCAAPYPSQRFAIVSCGICTTIAAMMIGLTVWLWDTLPVTERWVTVLFVALLSLTVPHSLMVRD